MKNKQSFSLIEMLIVIAIISVLSVSILINKQSNQSREDLLNAAKTMALDIREIQNFAMNSALESGRVPCGYGIKFYNVPNSENKYLAFYEIMSNRSADCGTDKKFGTMNLGEDPNIIKKDVDFIAKNIKINSIKVDSAASETSDIFFAPPDPIFYIDGITGKAIEIVMKIDGKTCPSDFCKSIKVNQLGQISIE